MTTNNLGKLNLLTLSETDSNGYVIKECLVLKTTGIAAMAGCTTTDVMVHNAASTLQTMETGSMLRPQTYTTSQVSAQKKVAVNLYNKVIAFMKGACNDAAISAGDINAGHTLAVNCGATIAKKSGGKMPDFGVIASGSGWVTVHAKKAAKGAEGHLFTIAIVTDKNIAPAKGACEYLFSLEGTIEITDLPSKGVLAINHSGLLPANQKITTPTIPSAASKKATKLAVSKKGHPSFSYTSPDPYTWDGWIYEVIQ